MIITLKDPFLGIRGNDHLQIQNNISQYLHSHLSKKDIKIYIYMQAI